MLEKKTRIPKLKVCLKSITLTRNSLVRDFVRSRLRLMDQLFNIDRGKWFHVPEGCDASAAEICSISAAGYYAVTGDILQPLVEGGEPEDIPRFNIPQPPIFTEADSFLEYMDDSLQEVIVFIRKHFRHLRKLDKIELPGSGKLSAKEWLLFLVEIEKQVTRQIRNLKRYYT